MIAITICATKSYCYAMQALSFRVQASLSESAKGVFILVGDDSKEFSAATEHFERIRPTHWELDVIKMEGLSETENYKVNAQKTIAAMRSQAFALARKRGVDLCWSLDSDVLPPANALLCMRQMLEFDGGFYGVSTCPYPSQGGALFLGGRGTPQSPILPCFYPDERTVPSELAERLKQPVTTQAEAEELREALEKCPPLANVFGLNAKQFRRRGWLDNAYPGIGLGAVVPVDWCGFGCTLMSRKALGLAEFSGYTGEGTEDLYIVWKKWHPAGIRINALTHCPADHVSRVKDKPGEFVLTQARHVVEAGEYIGHLRTENRPFTMEHFGV